MKAATSVEAILEQEFAKGETAGLELAKLILDHQVIHWDTEIEHLKNVVADNEGEEDDAN